METQKFTATLFFPAEKNMRPRKYRHGINNKTLARFSRFADSLGASYINLYCKETGHYLRRIKLIG